MPIELTIDEQGRVAFPADVLDHIGARPGQKIAVSFCGNGLLEVGAARPGCDLAGTGSIHVKGNDDELVDFSEFAQPAAVLRYLPPDVPRVLVDVGAHDGLQGSNSRGFLLQGWSGVLIEPMPKVFERLQKNDGRFDNVRLLNCAVGNRNGRADMSYPAQGETGQDASLYMHREHDVRLPVEVLTLDTILSQAGVPQQFGLLAIDTEGGDLEVLEGLDFTRYQPAVIVTEDYLPKHVRKRRLLQAAGYDFREKIGADSIWTSRLLVGDRSWPDQSPPLVRPIDSAILLSGKDGGSGEAWLDAGPSEPAVLRGWAHIGAARPIPPLVAVLMTLADGAYACFRGFRCPRSDVAAHFACDALLMCGFRIHLPPGFDRTTVSETALIQKAGDVIYRRDAPLS